MQKFPWGDRTLFKEKIIHPYLPPEQKEKILHTYPDLKPKIHTIREGFRWKPGNKIHMAYGTRSKNYDKFNEGIQQLETAIAVQSIVIYNTPQYRSIKIDRKEVWHSRDFDNPFLNQFAVNDGFPGTGYFFMYFNQHTFAGQLIHWTDKKY